ncbi:MAG: hypothetical protein WCE30_17590 [Mycobacterium sp.]
MTQNESTHGFDRAINDEDIERAKLLFGIDEYYATATDADRVEVEQVLSRPSRQVWSIDAHAERNA